MGLLFFLFFYSVFTELSFQSRSSRGALERAGFVGSRHSAFRRTSFYLCPPDPHYINKQNSCQKITTNLKFKIKSKYLKMSTYVTYRGEQNFTEKNPGADIILPRGRFTSIHISSSIRSRGFFLLFLRNLSNQSFRGEKERSNTGSIF